MSDKPSPFLLAQRRALAEAQTLTDAQLGAAIRKLNMSASLAKAHAAHIEDLEAENERLRASRPETNAEDVSTMVELPSSGSA